MTRRAESEKAIWNLRKVDPPGAKLLPRHRLIVERSGQHRQVPAKESKVIILQDQRATQGKSATEMHHPRRDSELEEIHIGAEAISELGNLACSECRIQIISAQQLPIACHRDVPAPLATIRARLFNPKRFAPRTRER